MNSSSSFAVLASSAKIRPRNELVPQQTSVLEKLYLFLFWSLFVSYTVVVFVGDTWISLDSWCSLESTNTYANPDTPFVDPCYQERSVYLLGLSAFECSQCRRMIVAVVLGAIIGYERKVSDRPAGIRTMGLVCLGSAIFTMCSQFAFRSSTMSWDAARVSAAIPSGVGFLGSALIWKQAVTVDDEDTTDDTTKRHQVHGLATAASVWLSASVGIGVGGGLYLYSVWAVVLVLFVLRLGPMLVFLDDSDYEEDGNDNQVVNKEDEDDSSWHTNNNRQAEEEEQWPTQEEWQQLLNEENAIPRTHSVHSVHSDGLFQIRTSSRHGMTRRSSKSQQPRVSYKS